MAHVCSPVLWALVIVTALIFGEPAHADDTGQATSDKTSDKICAFTDVACNLGKIGKSVKGLGVPKAQETTRGQVANDSGVKAGWAKVDADVADAKRQADAAAAEEAGQRGRSAQQRNAAQKCMALKDDAIAARTTR